MKSKPCSHCGTVFTPDKYQQRRLCDECVDIPIWKRTGRVNRPDIQLATVSRTEYEAMCRLSAERNA